MLLKILSIKLLLPIFTPIFYYKKSLKKITIETITSIYFKGKK